MAIYRASKSAEERLVEEPESGMGFQIIRHRGDLLVVLNATILVPLLELRSVGAAADHIAQLFAIPSDNIGEDLERMDLADDFRIAFSQLDPEYRETDTGLTSPEIAAAPPKNVISPKRPYSYYRFCASPRDRRVLRNGNFVKGTYATTYADFHFVPSGFAAVGRYALPNPASARFVFQITTYDRPTYMGTATPNFGQAGGGVEVLFGNGATNCPGFSFMIDAG